MGLKRLLLKPLSGYPGGYKKLRRGTQAFDSTPPFKTPDNPRDRRSKIRASASTGIGWAGPLKNEKAAHHVTDAGHYVFFFKRREGEVQALLDWCAHRAVYLS